MTMNVIAGTRNLSSDCNRRITIEVLGGGNQEPNRQGIYTITVPYSSLSKTLQGISRRGGTVIGISATTSQADATGRGQSTSRSGKRAAQRQQKPKQKRKTRLTRLTRRQSTKIQGTKQQPKQRAAQQTSADQPLSETFLKRLFSSK